MKTAVSIPDEVFEQAEELAARSKRSRSDIYARALAVYLARHAPDRVTDAMNRVLDDVDQPPDKFVARAARRSLERGEW
jgi:predicted transcriptional regulator